MHLSVSIKVILQRAATLPVCKKGQPIGQGEPAFWCWSLTWAKYIIALGSNIFLYSVDLAWWLSQPRRPESRVCTFLRVFHWFQYTSSVMLNLNPKQLHATPRSCCCSTEVSQAFIFLFFYNKKKRGLYFVPAGGVPAVGRTDSRPGAAFPFGSRRLCLRRERCPVWVPGKVWLGRQASARWRAQLPGLWAGMIRSSLSPSLSLSPLACFVWVIAALIKSAAFCLQRGREQGRKKGIERALAVLVSRAWALELGHFGLPGVDNSQHWGGSP